MAAEKSIQEQLNNLETHLKKENPVLLDAVKNFKALDQVAYKMGLLSREESYATQIPWWPLISILGTFSAGKSSFINTYLGHKLQRSGNQAVDDKFTVITYGNDIHTLPGVALDADPRFPFYQMSKDIETVAKGEGELINRYLQLKTCPSDVLENKIIIDSPGFDADAQRTATLRLAEHIIDLSDMVLVFFDARHPEPGAMQDTLKHLVSCSIERADAGKFLYILNQMDTTVREDNSDEVVAAWQRSLAETGLTAGRFYTIYNKDLSLPVEDSQQQQRMDTKWNEDMLEITDRMAKVEVERAYRIVAALEKTATHIEDKVVPELTQQLQRWKKAVLWGDGIAFGIFFGLLFSINSKFAITESDWWQNLPQQSTQLAIAVGGLVVLLLGIHFGIRQLTAQHIAQGLSKNQQLKGNIMRAFLKNTVFWRSVFNTKPAGWGNRTHKQIRQILDNVNRFVQVLNDHFTNPSGHKNASQTKSTEHNSINTKTTPSLEAISDSQ